MSRKIFIPLFVLMFLTMGCAYHGFTKMTVEGKNLKRGIMGGITGENVKITIIRETLTDKGEMCCEDNRPE